MRQRLARVEPPSFAFPLVRTQILENLAVSPDLAAKVVTIVAPTGYGKTVLTAALFQRHREAGAHCYWLALDDRDQTVDRVIASVEALLGSHEIDVHPTQALIRGDAPLETRADEVLDAVARLAEPSVVFIDNLGYCPDDTLGYLLDRLVFRTPSSVRFVFSSTVEIPFNRARAKLEGRLTEVGTQELSLRVEEIRELLGAELCTQLGHAGVETVLRQTEGWPAAVRLAQIILSTAARPSEALARFSGADEDLSSLLNRQVLAGFEPHTRTFLLELSLLRTFDVELAGHATGDGNAARHVALLVKRNVFVIPLDRNRSRYRLHGLFREFLLGEARRELPAERRRQVLERAADWCERQGQWQDAIDYALAAGSTGVAIAMLDRVAAMFVRDRGDLRQYIEWIEQLHAASHEVGWEADFWYVWALVFHRRYDTARQQNERLASRIERNLAAGEDAAQLAALKRRIAVIRICIDTYTDRLEGMQDQAAAWLAARGADDPFDVATVASASGIHFQARHRFLDARESMRIAQSAIAQAHSAYGVGWVALLSAMVPMFEGDYASVHSELLAALSRSRATLGEGTGISDTIALCAAKVSVEMGLDDEARRLLGLGLRRATTHGVVNTVSMGFEAAVKLWSGRPDDPIAIGGLREVASGYPPRASLMLTCFLVQRLVRLGRLDEARAEGAQIGLDVSGVERPPSALVEVEHGRSVFAMARIDLLIAVGQMRMADALVAEETRAAKRDGCAGRLVELALCEAAIAMCSHNAQPASRHFVRAIGLAARRRIVRPFRDRGELLAGMVNDTKPQGWGFALEEERKFFIEICRGLPLTNASLLDQLDHLQVETQLLETPTARELELLGLVEAGLSNQQLADRLSVSVATVKWHLYNLYTKLGVSSRSAALARARALNLLAR